MSAWEITIEDVEIALDDLGHSYTPEQVEELHGNLDYDEIIDTLLESCDFDEQCTIAHDEIKKQLKGLLE